jgi:hypothetical protein
MCTDFGLKKVESNILNSKFKQSSILLIAIKLAFKILTFKGWWSGSVVKHLPSKR